MEIPVLWGKPTNISGAELTTCRQGLQEPPLLISDIGCKKQQKRSLSSNGNHGIKSTEHPTLNGH
jgi:hypothetical protein